MVETGPSPRVWLSPQPTHGDDSLGIHLVFLARP